MDAISMLANTAVAQSISAGDNSISTFGDAAIISSINNSKDTSSASGSSFSDAVKNVIESETTDIIGMPVITIPDNGMLELLILIWLFEINAI